MAGEKELSGPDLAEEGLPAEILRFEVPVVGHLDGRPVVVVRAAEGVQAVGGKCTHYGGPLHRGICREGQIRCPWHHAAFRLATGEPEGPPALDPLAVYRVVEREGRIYVQERAAPPAPPAPPPAPPEAVVIVGAGAAGATAAEGLRRLGYGGGLTLIGEEPPVDRPNLSKDYLAGNAPEDWIPLRTPEFYEGNGMELVVGRRVESIDPGERAVRLDDGRRLPYDALLLAPGAEPRRLPVAGAELSHVRYLRTWDDCRSLIAMLGDAKRAAVVGAGFIGLEVAASLRARDIAVSVVAPERTPLVRAVGKTLGGFVADLHREHGVDFHLGAEVAGIDAGEVALDDGASLPADLVVVGIGVEPRTRLAAESGLEVDNGIVVDECLRTRDPHIWAAGDAANYPGPGGERRRVEHWVLAQRQGRTAAGNILGGEAPFRQPPFFWSRHYDRRINVTGHAADWDEELVSGDPRRGPALVGYRRAGEVVAVASVARDADSLRAEQALATGDQAALHRLLRAASFGGD